MSEELEAMAVQVEGRHTKGPWLVSPFSARVEVPDCDAPICEMLWPTDLRSEDETYANAVLSAAAPELLEALQASKNILDQLIDPQPGQSALVIYAQCKEAQIKARAAISRAQGV